MRFNIITQTITVLLALNATCLAWNGEGHQVIAYIAEERLSNKAKAGVRDLLGDAQLSDAEIANWADQIRRERRNTAPWHYVNIPVEAAGYDPARDGRKGNNVIDKVKHFSVVLADRKRPREEREEALKFLVHFVGDLHQPLHCADRNKDKGGNACMVFFPGQRKAMNLHEVWDTFMLRSHKGTRSVSDYGAKLNREISDTDVKAWATGTPLGWATESWKIAKDKVYAPVPADASVPTLSKEYVTGGGEVADVQIKKAGIRLAEMLNTAFR